jgi:hypothetical protein
MSAEDQSAQWPTTTTPPQRHWTPQPQPAPAKRSAALVTLWVITAAAGALGLLCIIMSGAQRSAGFFGLGAALLGYGSIASLFALTAQVIHSKSTV